MSKDVKKIDVAVIGAGFGGIGVGIALRKKGIENFVIFEGGDEVGGSWLTNRYPGCACDVPSHLYSYSFAPNPRWTQAYSSHSEIHQYIMDCAEKFDLYRHIAFKTPVSAANFNAEKGVWEITTKNGERVNARVLIPATGALSLPKFPDIEGRESFKGEQIHAANWDNSINLRGKRVAVIGTGASAVQVVPSIAADVEHLYVFQRTASWVLPKMNRQYSEAEKRTWTRYPITQKLSRYFIYWTMEVAAPALIWFPKLLKLGQLAHRRHLHKAIQDPVLRDKLTPRYQLGCKRALVSDDFYPTFNRSNVTLVTDGIESMDSTGFSVAGGDKIDVDVVIYTTGYETGEPMFPFTIHGKNGTNLTDYWAGQPKAYYGMNVSDYPNMGLIMGPNAGPGHTSVLIYQEAQYKYLANYAKHIIDNDIKSLDIKKAEMDGMFQWAQKRMKNSTWLSGCASWYLNEDGTNSTMWPGFSFEYLWRTRNLNLDAYHQS
ncbi:NAD(P)/FAD-dependent oxidoreductase [Maricurvus nonylphenolicus]|uniref:flavin-containing monooxygenase n=1 Tax=Maricurvus nonylphenolicus TaxID=1008307 RepID=UPI0036F44DD7